MKFFLSIFLLLIAITVKSQVIPVDFSPLRSYIAKVQQDSSTVVTISGRGIKPIVVTQNGASIRFKSIVYGPGIRVRDVDTSLVFDRVEWVRTVTTSYTILPEDENIIYSGTTSTAFTFPSASTNPGRPLIISNRAATTTSISTNIGVSIQGRRLVKFVSDGTAWRQVYSITLASGF